MATGLPSTPAPTAPPRVLVICQDRLGAAVAGPAIRAVRSCEALLSAGCAVTLLLAQPPDDQFQLPGATLHVCTPDAPLEPGLVRDLANRADVVVTQPLRIDVERALAGSTARLVFDLYVPTYVEELSQQALAVGPPVEARQLVYRKHQLQSTAALASADAVLCASEAQKHFWLGALGALGRLDAQQFLDDPRFDDLVRVVPFGVDDHAPVHSGVSAVRGVVPGVDDGSLIALWAGGMWDWLDPLTPIRAVAAVRDELPHLHLCFLGTGHPSPLFGGMATVDRARALVDELDLAENVHFLAEWVPFERRTDFLLEADLGVVAHFDNVETRLAFRTRVLDHFWAGLPTITTLGGALADLVEARGAGTGVAAGDVDGWAAAFRDLARPEARDQRRDATRGLADELRWSRTTAGLVDLVTRLATDTDRHRTPRVPLGPLLRAYALTSARVNRMLFGRGALLRRPGSLLR